MAFSTEDVMKPDAAFAHRDQREAGLSDTLMFSH